MFNGLRRTPVFNAAAETLTAKLLEQIGLPLKALGKDADLFFARCGWHDVTIRDLRGLRLSGRDNTLNDVICDIYFELIRRRAVRMSDAAISLPEPSKKISLLVLTCVEGVMFLLKHHYKQVMLNATSFVISPRTAIGTFFSVDKVLIPINNSKQNHWALVVVNNLKKRFEFYNSWVRDPTDYEPMFTVIQDFMKRQIVIGGLHSNSEEHWSLMDCDWYRPLPVVGRAPVPDTEIPGQENSVDCGVFMSTFGSRLSLDSELDFTQADIPMLRQRMLFEIARGRLV